jgi:hypothetical protein
MKYSLLLSFTAVLLPFGMQAQKGATTPTPTPVPTTPGRPTTPNFPNNPTQPNTTNNTANMPARPVFLSGKVIMEDGTPPPDSVRIEKICSGNPRPQGYTDSKGRFSFQLDGGMDVMADASDASFARPGSNPAMGGMDASGRTGNSTRRTSLNGCDLRASLAGFRSDSVNLSFHDSLDNPNVGTIVLHRIGNVEGTTISMTSLNAPKDAQKAFQKGRDALKKQKTAEAEKEFQKAVGEYPKYAAAWYELGRVQVAMNQPAEAEKSFQNSIAADSKMVTPYLELTLLFAKAKDWDKMLETSNRAIKLNPMDFPVAYFYNSVANLNLQNIDAAEKSALEAQKLDSRHQIVQIGKLLDTITAAKKPTAAAAPEPKP